MGISLGDLQADCLSNLRFADDVAIVLYIPGAAQKYDVRVQETYRERRAENPPGYDENSQQPRFWTEEKW